MKFMQLKEYERVEKVGIGKIKIGLAGVVLAIVFVVAFNCFNRKEQNKIERKETKKK